MVNIAILFFGTKPDPDFVLLVQQFLREDQVLDAEGKISIGQESRLKTFLLTEKNIEEQLQEKQEVNEKRTQVETTQAACHPSTPSETLYQAIADGTNLLIFNINTLKQKSRLLSPLLKILEESNCAILLLNPKLPAFKHIILKYDGTGASILSFAQLFPEKARKAVSTALISPLVFKKYQIAAEKRFIKKATAYYGALGFIKLPLNSIRDLLQYAGRNKADLLIISRHDLKDLFKTLRSKDALLARRYPSVFIAATPLHKGFPSY